MAKTDLICCLLKKHNCKLSIAMKLFLEVKFITRICQELSKIFKLRYKEYQLIIKPDSNLEENMSSINFMQNMIKDILSTNEYSLAGIATYTHIPEEVLSDVTSGINSDLTFEFSRKIFELHIAVRRNFYDELMHKVALEYLPSSKNAN